MAVYHILKDGTKLSEEEFKGHIIRIEDFPELYHIIARMSQDNIKNEPEKSIDTQNETTKNKLNNFGIIERINEELLRRNISKEEFYKSCGISSASFSQWNTGKSFPSRKTIAKIAAYFGWENDFLLTGQSNKNNTVLSEEEKRILIQYRLCNKTQRSIINQILNEFYVYANSSDNDKLE